MSSFVLKIIACITMVCDHVRYIIPEANIPLTQILGRMSYPLFAFLITEGYVHTRDLKKYYIRIIVFTIVSQIPFMLYRSLIGDWKLLNIMATLLLGLIAITIYDKCKNKFISIIIAIGIIVIGKIIKVDYSWWGVSIIVIFYIFRNNKPLLIIEYFLVTVLYYYLRWGNEIISNGVMMRYMISSLITPVFILLYNGKSGKKLKYFFYVFYPAHMLILYFISNLLSY